VSSRALIFILKLCHSPVDEESNRYYCIVSKIYALKSGLAYWFN
jgi:hypothetical protein